MINKPSNNPCSHFPSTYSHRYTGLPSHLTPRCGLPAQLACGFLSPWSFCECTVTCTDRAIWSGLSIRMMSLSLSPSPLKSKSVVPLPWGLRREGSVLSTLPSLIRWLRSLVPAVCIPYARCPLDVPNLVPMDSKLFWRRGRMAGRQAA